ncbi:MAG: hypothetical protein MI864_15680 [Pseudomonadales bacterium]|nr:hypothetical protein [Pseudomonadales bacterium]
MTSFNNNPPNMDTLGASAGQGFYYNYGAQTADQGGGGHTEFSAKHGSPTAENGSFVNYGCGAKLDSHSSAGHTIFSINLPTIYRPTAGNGLFWNHPGLVEGAPAGYTEFSVYGDGTPGSNIPTAENGTFINLGANSQYATGGYTTFSGSTTAGSAQLIALGGTNGGNGGRINFYDNAQGESATVQLYGNGTLNISDHTGGLQISSLEATGGTIEIQLGTTTTDLTLTGDLILKSSSSLDFYFWKKDNGGFEPNTAYTVLTAANLAQFSASNFTGNSVDGVEPTFTVSGNTLTVSFNQN